MVEERIITINEVEYIVSSDGHIYSTHDSARSRYHQEIKQRANEDGYMVVTTGKTGNRRLASVHRMVAEAFVPNPNNLPEVNHIDCDRTNNCAENLEWCTHTENIYYSIKMGNHICTTDISGANNPNFGNDTLKRKYAENVSKYLSEYNIPISGKDKISLHENIAIQDLISLLKFVFLHHCQLV